MSSSIGRPTSFAVCEDDENVVFVGYSNGRLARFDDACGTQYRPSSSMASRTRVIDTPSWIADPSPSTSYGSSSDDEVAVDAVSATSSTGRVVRCGGVPPTVEVLSALDGAIIKRLRIPTSWPCTGSCAVTISGCVGNFTWALSATKWNHSGDEFAGNSATCAVWRVDGDDSMTCATFNVNSSRPSASGSMHEDMTLAPFAATKCENDAFEYVTAHVNYGEENIEAEFNRFTLRTSNSGIPRAERVRGGSLQRINLGWYPKYRAVRDRALNRNPKSTPVAPFCVLNNHFAVTIWSDGENPVIVADRRTEQAESRRHVRDALRAGIESCVRSADAQIERSVMDAFGYDGDAYVAIVVRDSRLVHGSARSTKECDVKFRLFLVPTGVRSDCKSVPSHTEPTAPLMDMTDVDVATETCAICLDQFATSVYVRTPCCGTVFCTECLSSYMSLKARGECPACRDVHKFWSSASAETPAFPPGVVEVELNYDMRQAIRAYRALIVEDDDYAEMDDRHLRGDRKPLALRGGFVYAIDARGLLVQTLQFAL